MDDVLLLVGFALSLFFAGVFIGMRLIMRWLARTNLTINVIKPKLHFHDAAESDPA